MDKPVSSLEKAKPRQHLFLTAVWTLLILLLLAGCSDSNQADPGDGAGGIGGTGVTRGAISRIDHIAVVNGIKFDLTDSVLIRNNRESSEQNFLVGDVVYVLATYPDKSLDAIAKAKRMEYAGTLEGPVESLPADDQLEVLGQTVFVDRNTAYANLNTLEDLKVGDMVEVSGFHDAANNIIATGITRRPNDPNAPKMLKGYLSELDTNQRRFHIGKQTVDYANAQLIGLDESGLKNGRYIGVWTRAGLENGVFVARKIKPAQQIPPLPAGIKANISGVVTRQLSDTKFEINGQPIEISDDETQFFNNHSADDIVLNARIDIRGDVHQDGAIEAYEIHFLQTGDQCLQSQLERNHVFPAESRLQLLGIDAEVRLQTLLIDRQAKDKHPLALSSLKEGDTVRICGYRDYAQHFIATRIDRLDTNKRKTFVKGYGSRFDAITHRASILGVDILTTPDTVYQISDGHEISAEAFFNRAAHSGEYMLIATGELTSTSPYTLQATQLRLTP